MTLERTIKNSISKQLYLWNKQMDNNITQAVLVKDINPNSSGGYRSPSFAESSFPENFVEFNDRLYFSANNGNSGSELFVSDGTDEGTQLLVDLRPGSSNYGYNYGSNPSNFVEFNNRLYFQADNGDSGRELFVSDGTAEGTQLLVDLRPGSSNYGYNYGINPSNFVEFNDRLYFQADNGESGRELFVSDGTAEGTQLLVDLRPGSSNYGYNYGSNPSNFVEFNDRLYFTANNGESGSELFVSDGTAEGTQLLVDLRPGSSNYGYNYGSYPSNFVEFNDRLYFTARDGESGTQLFVSDGTAEGTQLLVDVNSNNSEGYDSSLPFPDGFYPSNLIEFDGRLYFTANDGESGRELFVSDGTAEGTQLLVDLRPGSSNYGYNYGSNPANLVEFDGKLYFTANDGINGNELFVTDGTAEGTQLVADIDPGSSNYGFSYSSYPRELTVVGDELFFSADNDEVGRELFKLEVVDVTPVVIAGSDRADNLVGSDRFEDIQTLSGNDTVDSGGGNDTVDGGDGNDIITSTSGDDSLIGGNGNDTIESGDGADTLLGGNGADLLDGLDGSDSLAGGTGNDTLLGSNGNDTLSGDDGNDLINGGSGSDNLVGGEGNDVLDGGDGRDILFGNNGSDILNAGSGDDYLAGGESNDILNGGEGRDTLSGGNSDDRLVGNEGNDNLIGGTGNDFLDSGRGFDFLEGGSGDDVFVLRVGDGRDTIIDFELGSDRLGLVDGLEFDSLSFSGDNILFGREVLANLVGINTEQFTSSDFRTI